MPEGETHKTKPELYVCRFHNFGSCMKSSDQCPHDHTRSAFSSSLSAPFHSRCSQGTALLTLLASHCFHCLISLICLLYSTACSVYYTTTRYSTRYSTQHLLPQLALLLSLSLHLHLALGVFLSLSVTLSKALVTQLTTPLSSQRALPNWPLQFSGSALGSSCVHLPL